MSRLPFAALSLAIIGAGTLLLLRQHDAISTARAKPVVPVRPTNEEKLPGQTPAPSPELLKLRNAVTMLRQELKEAAPAGTIGKKELSDEWAQVHSGAKPSEQPGFISNTELTNAGHATPDAAFQSFLYVIRNQHKEKLTPTKTKEIFEVPDDFDDPNARYSIHLGEGVGREVGYRVVQQQFVSSNEVRLTIDFEDRDGGSFRRERTVVLRNGQWRVKPAGVSRVE